MSERPTASFKSLSQLVPDLVEDAQRRRDAKSTGRNFGPSTGFSELDALLGGRLEVGLHVLHGSPGVGKSALALGIAAECGTPALFVSAELGAGEILRRLIARQTKEYLRRLKSGELTAARVEELALATVATLPLLGIMDATCGIASSGHIASALDALRNSPHIEKARGDGALVVVDSAHTWAARVWPDQDEYPRLGLALAELEILAQTLKIPVLLVSERNRASMKSGGQSASAGSRRFEYAGESVFELDLGDTEEDSNGDKTVNLTVSKNRHGRCGVIPMKWHGATQRHAEEGDFS